MFVLSLITDAREWRHYKQLSRLTTPVEEAMFTSASSDKNKPQIFLRSKETVNIPLKFQTFKTDMSVQPQVRKDSNRGLRDHSQIVLFIWQLFPFSSFLILKLLACDYFMSLYHTMEKREWLLFSCYYYHGDCRPRLAPGNFKIFWNPCGIPVNFLPCEYPMKIFLGNLSRI